MMHFSMHARQGLQGPMRTGKHLTAVAYHSAQFTDTVPGSGIDGAVTLIDVKDRGKDKICAGSTLVRGETHSVRQKDSCIAVSIPSIWYVYYASAMSELPSNSVPTRPA